MSGMTEDQDEMRAALLALPINTVVKIGHRFPDTGNLQGSLYMRAGAGLRYVGIGRDDTSASTLNSQVCRSDDFEVVSSPAAARLRSLAAIYEQPLNRDKTFTFKGSELAAMLKEEW